MTKLIFATHNKHKLNEINQILGREAIKVVGLRDLNFDEDIPEPFNTLDENALQKANFIHNLFGSDCFADDTGLEVEALGGEPGVLSARYAGEPSNADRNMDKLLLNMQGITNRNARFRTLIALIYNSKKYIFEGVVEGKITEKRCGNNGFGYDPVFVPNGYQKTFAEMSEDEKNGISHRAIAIKKLVDFLISNTAI